MGTLIQDQITLGQAIKMRRKSLKLRIDDAAALIGVSVSTLSALENGSRPVGSDKLLAVLNGLGIDWVLSSGDDSGAP